MSFATDLRNDLGVHHRLWRFVYVVMDGFDLGLRSCFGESRPRRDHEQRGGGIGKAMRPGLCSAASA